MGKISCVGGVFVAVAGMCVTEVRTGGLDVMVAGLVFSLDAASFRPSVKVSCVAGKGLGRLQGREEDPSIKRVQNLSGREAGLLANAQRSSAVSWVSRSSSSSWCGTRRLVEHCRSRLQMKSL